MVKRIFFLSLIIFFIVILLLSIFNIKIVKFYFIDSKGNPDIVYIKFMKLPVDRTKALHKIINTYLNYAKNRNVNSELLPYISLERVRINNNKCILNIKLLLNDGASLSSYTEDRTLIMLLTTIKSYMKNLKYFKIYGLENDFKHIDTRFPFTLNDQNLVIVGD